MEMSYLRIYEWVYEKVLSSIVTPMLDFVVSIINIVWGYVFQYIPRLILLPVLQAAFYWVTRIVKVLGTFMNYLQFIGYLMAVDCLEKTFGIFIGLEPAIYYSDGREGVAVTGDLLEVLFTSAAIPGAFKVITLGGAGIALLLAAFGVTRSSLDLGFENKRPVSHVFKQLFKSILDASLTPFAVWSMMQLPMIVLTTLNTAVSFDGSEGRSILGSTIFTIVSMNAAWDSENNMSRWGTVELDEGFSFKVLDRTNSDFDIAREPGKNFYLNGTHERYTSIPNMILNFDLSRLDYLMGGWIAVFLCVILFLCFLIVIRRMFEILLLYLVSSYLMVVMPLDDGEKFRQQFGMFMRKFFTSYGAVVLMKIYLMLMPPILRGGIIAEGMGGESRIVMTAFYVMGGAWTMYKADSLLTGLVNEVVGRPEQEGNRNVYGAAMSVATPLRAIKNRLEQKVSRKLEERITGADKDVGTQLQGEDPKGSGTRSKIRASHLRSKPPKQPKFKKTVIYDELKNSFGFTIGGHRPVRGGSRQLEPVSKAAIRNVKKSTLKHINFENDKRSFKYGYDQFGKNNAFIKNKDDTVDSIYPAKRKSAALTQGGEIVKVREEALSRFDPRERSRYVINWLQHQSDDKNSLMYFNLADRIRLERTFGCKIDKVPISSGINKRQIAFYPEKPKLPNGTKLNPDKSKGNRK